MNRKPADDLFKIFYNFLNFVTNPQIQQLTSYLLETFDASKCSWKSSWIRIYLILDGIALVCTRLQSR